MTIRGVEIADSKKRLRAGAAGDSTIEPSSKRPQKRYLLIHDEDSLKVFKLSSFIRLRESVA